MKNILYLLLLLFVWSPISAQDRANGSPEMSFDQTTHEFGTIAQGVVVEHTFKFSNKGTTPLIISSANGSCGCTVPIWPKEPIMPGDEGEIKVSFNSEGKYGMQYKTVTINYNSDSGPVILHMKGKVERMDVSE
jgi:hypothetical protein